MLSNFCFPNIVLKCDFSLTVVILSYVVLFVDINECDDATACHDSATCTNTEGSYSCACNEGYTGNGRVCIGMNDFPLKYKGLQV